MGWIFFKPSYERMESIDKNDLERDPGQFLLTICLNEIWVFHTLPVVRYQHRNYSKNLSISNMLFKLTFIFSPNCVFFWDYRAYIIRQHLGGCQRGIRMGQFDGKSYQYVFWSACVYGCMSLTSWNSVALHFSREFVRSCLTCL